MSNILKTYESFSDEKMKDLLSKKRGFDKYHQDVDAKSVVFLKEWVKKQIIKNLPERIEIFEDKNKIQKSFLSFKIDEIICFIKFENNYTILNMQIFDGVKDKEWVNEIDSTNLDYFIKRMKDQLSKVIGPDNINRRKSEAGIDKYNL